jgi:hypothetical protein
MRQILGVAILAVALSGCAGQPLAPPGMPTIAAIQATEAQLAAVPATDVPVFYKTGLFLAQEQCGGYFDAAVMRALKNAQTSGQAQLLSGLATGLLGLAGAGGPATAGVGLATGFGTQLLANQQDTSLAGSDPAATATLVATAQGQLIAAMANPASAADALADIYGVYRACSPAGIRGMEEEAIQAAPNHLSVVGGSAVMPTPAFAPRTMMRRPSTGSGAALPMVRVN